MNLLLGELPDTHAELVVWLERKLVSFDLGQLVMELAAFRKDPLTEGSVRLLLGDECGQVLTQGLRILDEGKIRSLLEKPLYLLELQELVLTYGGRYWRNVESELEIQQHLEEQWRILKGRMASPEPPIVFPMERKLALGWAWLLLPLGIALGIALGFALAHFVRPRSEPPSVQVMSTHEAWGWQKRDCLLPAESEQAYFDRLATRLEEWFTMAPTGGPQQKRQLAQRLCELRNGCSILALSLHPLTQSQSETLNQHAVKWGESIDKAIQQLDSGRDPNRVTDSVNERIHEIARDLRRGLLS